MSSKPKIFAIMPFDDDSFKVYNLIKKKFDNEFDFSQAKDEDNQQSILADIIQPMHEADIIFANLTGLNPNVMYELGIAHTMNKKTVMISKDSLDKLPFDVKLYRVNDYTMDYEKFNELLDNLGKYFRGAITGDVKFSNPVNDFMVNNLIDISRDNSNISSQIIEYEEEKGFLDFLADIEDNTKDLTSKIMIMNDSMKEMSTGVEVCSHKVEQINKPGGTGNTFLVKKQVQNAANYISNFDKSLKQYNTEHGEIWKKIESDVLGLLENKFAQAEENRNGLIEYLYSLNELKGIISNNIQSMSSMKKASLNNIGIEKNLTYAIKSLDKNLETYLELLDTTSVSIDKILTKSKFVVGDIDFDITRGNPQIE